jgi:phage gp46-like protein
MADFLLDDDGDYVISNGSFVLDGTARTAVILALRDQRGKWWADRRIGSRIDELFQGPPPVDPGAVAQGSIREALTPLVQRGRLQSFESEVTSSSPLLVTVRARDGQQAGPIVLTLAPVG